MIIIRPMDIRAVDLNLLKAFDALMTERAVTRAASRIGLSQPAMSHALSRLRGLFADELFVRAATGMEPTARAREIAPLVTAAIEHIEAALRLGAGFDPATSTAIFTAGMAEYAEIALVGPLARAFARKAPAATLRLLPATGRGLVCRQPAGAYRCNRVIARPVRRCRAARSSGCGPANVARNLCRAEPRAGVAARRHDRRARPHPCRFRAEAADCSAGCDLSGGAGGARQLGPHRDGAAPRRGADRRECQDRDHPAADRLRDDGVDGLAPPRHWRSGVILVP